MHPRLAIIRACTSCRGEFQLLNLRNNAIIHSNRRNSTLSGTTKSSPNVHPSPSDFVSTVVEDAVVLAARILSPEVHRKWVTIFRSEDLLQDKRSVGFLRESGHRRLDVLAALLADPLAGVDTLQVLHDRVPSEKLEISWSKDVQVDAPGASLRLPASKLLDWNADIHEVLEPRLLFGRDVALVVEDESLPSYVSHHPALILVRKGLGPAAVPHPHNVIEVDAEEAIRSFKAFRDKAITDFQHMYTRSNLSSVQSAVKEALSNPRRDAAGRMRVVARGMLSECRDQLDQLREDIMEAQIGILAAEIVEREMRDAIKKSFEEVDFERHFKAGEKILQRYVEAFRWWKIWKVDSIGLEMDGVIRGVYATELEQELNFFAGTLVSKQATIHIATSHLVERLPASFKSAVLVNDISRIRQHHKSNLVHSSTLTSSLAHRRSQLIDFALPTLQSQLERSVLNGLGFSALSLVSTVWLNAASVLEGETAFSLGLFGVLGAIRIGVGRWEKAKKKWRADFARVSGGLKADIEARFTALLEQNLFKELELVRDRAQSSIDEKNEVMRALTAELDGHDQKMQEH